MKLLLVLSLYLVSSTACYSQDEVVRKNDSLTRLFNQNTNHSIKVNILIKLAELWKNKSYIRTLAYTRQAIDFSEKHLSEAKTQGIKYMLAFTYMEMGDAVRSLEILHQLAKEFENEDSGAYSTALAFIAMNYDNQGNTKKALEYQIKASNIFENLALTDTIIDSRPYLGNPQKIATYYLKNNQLDSALLYGQKAFKRLHTVALTDWNRFFSWYIKTTSVIFTRG